MDHSSRCAEPALPGHALWGRLRYLRTFFALQVDLTAQVLPAVLGLLGAGDLRVLRLLRLLRMLKLTPAIQIRLQSAVGRCFVEEARSILAVLFVVGISLTMSAATMYLVEGDAQPEAFKSILARMWWAIAKTITTVGYGDMVPITPAGRVVGAAGAIVSIVGIGTLALFTGLITISFMDQLRIRRLQYRRMIKAQLAAGPLGPEERDAIERQGARMGLGEREAVGLVEEVCCSAPEPESAPIAGHLAVDGSGDGGGGGEGSCSPTKRAGRPRRA